MDDYAPQPDLTQKPYREFKWYWHKPTGNFRFKEITGLHPAQATHDELIRPDYPNFEWNDFHTGYAQVWPGQTPNWKWYGKHDDLPYEADDLVQQHLQNALQEGTGSPLASRQRKQVSQIVSAYVHHPEAVEFPDGRLVFHEGGENFGLDSHWARDPYLYDPDNDLLHWGESGQWHTNLRPNVEKWYSQQGLAFPGAARLVPGAVADFGNGEYGHAIYDRYLPYYLEGSNTVDPRYHEIQNRLAQLVGHPIMSGETPDSLMGYVNPTSDESSSIISTGDDWLPKLGSDWAPSLDDRYKNRRPWMLDASNLKNPNPAIWIGNAGEFHPGISTFVTNNDLPHHAWDGVLKGEVDESTSPPTFKNYDYTDWKDDNGETVVHPRKSYAISQIERAYYQMMDKPEQRSAKLGVADALGDGSDLDDWAPVLNYSDVSPNAVGHLKFLYSDKLPNKIMHWEPEENWGDPDFLPAHYDQAKDHGLDYEDYTPGIGTIFPDYISLGVHRGNNDHGRALQETARDYFSRLYPGMPIYWSHGGYGGLTDESYREEGYEKLASWKDKYDYRIVDGDNKKTCSTCSAFKTGHCRMFYNAKVDERGYCTEWSQVWAPKIAGLPDRKVGDRLYFEYHCHEGHDSNDAIAWYHSHQPCTVIEAHDNYDEKSYGEPKPEGWNADMRSDWGAPKTYRVRFDDGVEWDVFEDELVDSPSAYYRPDPPSALSKKLAFDIPYDYKDYVRPNHGELPPRLYHVAPRSAREDILASGLDPTGRTYNTGGNPDLSDWNPETGMLSNDAYGGEYEWRPEGVYMFDTPDQARQYAGFYDQTASRGAHDIWEINSQGVGHHNIIRDPSRAFNWGWDDENERGGAYVAPYVPSQHIRLVDPSEHLAGSDWMADSTDSWHGPQSVDKFKIDVPGEAPGIGPIGYIPGEQNTLLRSPCWCDVGATMPHEWGPTCENGLHPTMEHKAAVLPNEPWNDPMWLEKYQERLDNETGMYGDHVEVANPRIPFVVLEDGRTWIGYDAWSHSYDWMVEDAERELGIDYYEMKDTQGSVNFAGNEYQVNWPLHGLHRELEPQIVTDVVKDIEEQRQRSWEHSKKQSSMTASPDHWVWLDGHVAFGGDHHDIADRLTKQIGYDPNHSIYVGNMIARGLQPQGHNVAVGTLKGGYPHIWMSTVDRNAVWDDVARSKQEQMQKVAWSPIDPQDPQFSQPVFGAEDEWDQMRDPYRGQGVTIYRGMKLAMPSRFDMLAPPQDPEEFKQRQMFDIQANSKLDWKGIGLHWTSDPEVAKNFARPNKEFGSYGLILQAQVMPQDIVQDGTPEHRHYHNQLGVLGPMSSEGEITVRPGAHIRILRGTAILADGTEFDTVNTGDVIIPIDSQTWYQKYEGEQAQRTASYGGTYEVDPKFAEKKMYGAGDQGGSDAFSDRTPYIYYPHNDALYWGVPGLFHWALEQYALAHMGEPDSYPRRHDAVFGSVYQNPENPDQEYQAVHRSPYNWGNPWTDENHELPYDKKDFLAKRLRVPFHDDFDDPEIYDSDLDWTPKLAASDDWNPYETEAPYWKWFKYLHHPEHGFHIWRTDGDDGYPWHRHYWQKNIDADWDTDRPQTVFGEGIMHPRDGLQINTYGNPRVDPEFVRKTELLARQQAPHLEGMADDPNPPDLFEWH